MATETTTTSARAWRPDHSAFHPGDIVPDAIILHASMVSGSIEGDAPALRVAYVSDDEAAFVAEAGEITEANPGLSEVVIHTGKIAQLVRLSNEQFNQDGTATNLSESVRRAIVRKANEAFVRQPAPTSPAVTPPAGLINITGIEDGGAVADNLDGLIDLIAAVESNGGEATHLLMAPDAWASVRKFKTGTGSAASLLGAGTADAERRLLGVPVLVTPALATGTGLVLDRTAIVSAVGQIQVATSQDAYFAHDSVGLRATWRIGWNVVHPDRIGKFTITDPDTE